MHSLVLAISLDEKEFSPIAQAISGGSFYTGIQKLTAIMFVLSLISPHITRKCLIGHINCKKSTSIFMLTFFILYFIFRLPNLFLCDAFKFLEIACEIIIYLSLN